MKYDKVIDWLLEGDISIQYQVHRDMLHYDNPRLRDRIATEGWGALFLSKKHEGDFWGKRFYEPKWISTHYTVLDLKNLCISPECPDIKSAVAKVLTNLKSPDGGIFPIGSAKKSDVCVNGMFLNYASYFRMNENELKSIIDFLLSERMADGGFNCNSNGKGAVHSSVHTTLSVIEGFLEYAQNSYTYRLKEIQNAECESREFLLQHRLFKSDHTGEIINRKFLMLSYPSRWRYDILRALDYFRCAGVSYDTRMDDAIQVLLKKRSADNRWPLQAKHHGQTHFEMEEQGIPSRWNTLRVLRVLRYYGINS
ncbi:MAG: hypothetical protein JXB48_20425 [Candidatus Latescibacteria bacterium]|nr:hypothetical protein [Candidatus Latescibacterota bacterium]